MVKISYFSDVEAKAVDWLWYPYIPYGKITIIQGDPGEGKTTFALHLAALLSKGAPLPDGSITDPINVIYQSAEDSAQDTIKPRLEKMEADCNRIAFILDEEARLSFTDYRLCDAIKTMGARLLILDPLQAFIPTKHDMGRANDMRSVMGRLASIAAETNCAVLIIGHMTKAATTKGIYRGIGSIDIAAIARSILMIGRPEEDSDFRVMVHIKSNLAPLGNNVGFAFDARGRFVWQELDIEYTAQDLMGKNKTRKHHRAEEVLQEILEQGEALASDVYAACMAAGIGKRTVDQAKKNLAVHSVRKGDRWYWQL